MTWRSRANAGDEGEFVTENGKKLLLVQIEPKLNGKQSSGFLEDLELVYLAARHVGVDIFAIKENDWPISVHVCSHKLGIKPHDEIAQSSDLSVIAWAEVFQIEKKARVKI